MALQGTDPVARSRTSIDMAMAVAVSGAERDIKIVADGNLKIDPSPSTLYRIARHGYS